MIDKRLMIAAAMLAFTAPAGASAAQGAPTTAKPATAQAAKGGVPNRATLQRGIDGNFKAIDTNNDGLLDSSELAAAEAKVQQQRLANMRKRIEGEFAKLDTNKNGSLSKAEFMAAAPTAPQTPPNGAALVSQLDKNKDGKVNIEEFRAPILARFDKADTNRDGTISDAERQANVKK